MDRNQQQNEGQGEKPRRSPRPPPPNPREPARPGDDNAARRPTPPPTSRRPPRVTVPKREEPPPERSPSPGYNSPIRIRKSFRDTEVSPKITLVHTGASTSTDRNPSPNRDFGATTSTDRSPSPTLSPRKVRPLIGSSLPDRNTAAIKSAQLQEALPSTSTNVKFISTAIARDTPHIFKRRKEDSPPEKPQTIPLKASRPSVQPGDRRTKANRILYSTDEEVRDALVEFAVFIIFLVLTSLVTLSVRHSYMFYFNDTMKKLFTTRDLVVAPSVTVSFEKLITVPDWWDYLVFNYLVTLHGDLTSFDDNATAPSHPDKPSGDSSPESEPSDGSESDARGDDEDARLKDEMIDDPGWDYHIRKARQAETAQAAASAAGDTSNITIPTTHLMGRVFLYENLLLGPPRIRQIRVRKESCYVNDAFIRYFNTCYAAYSAGAEDRKDSFMGTPYMSMNDLETTPLWTVLAFYRSGGYVVDLTYDKDKNLKIIRDLRDMHWLDRGSRLCLIEFNLYNDNTNIYQSVKFIAEIPPTGGVIPQAHLQTVKQYSFFTDTSMTMSVIYIFWYIMVVFYTITEITEARKAGCRNYISSMLNILDCIILSLCYLALVYNIWHTYKVRSVNTRAKTQNTYQSLDGLCFWNIIYVDMMAILAFLVWIKIFKFISFNKTLVQFTTTLKRCSKDLAGFSLMFGIVFLAYAQLGLLLFGTKHPDFRNFITSILTMIRMILGDFQYNLIEQANRVLGPIYFLTYILLVFFILLNMFLAIIMETYNSVKSEITQGRSHLGSYIYKNLMGMIYWITHCGRKRRPQVTESPEEEALEADAPAQEGPQEMRRNLTPAQAKYFQQIPPGENADIIRLSNRVGLLEEILEQLITNMDDILKRVERERLGRR